MHRTGRVLVETLARDEREVRRQLAALRRRPSGRLANLDTAAAGGGDLFEVALRASAGQHDEIVRKRLADKLRALAEAQERVREGTYGLCRDCGRPIPRRRLEAMPTATLCLPCQEKREATLAA